MTRVYLRWVPAVVVTTVIAAGALAVPLQAGAAVDLPDKTPQEVLKLIGESTVDALSGTIQQTSDLGLPDLSVGGSSAGGSSAGGTSSGDEVASALELLTGNHTARIYVDGHDKARVQVMDRMSERDLIVNGDNVWVWDSKENTATQLAAPSHDTGDRPTSAEARTPAELAEKFLDKVDSTTEVTVDDDTEVAGRAAYDLVLTPRTSGTLVGSVSIAVDSETGLPLRVQVTAQGESEPAFRLEFTELSLEAPDAGLFEFEPPPGATVEEQELPRHPEAKPGTGQDEMGDFPGTVSGSGWDAVVELPAGTAPAELTESPLFAQATEAVDEGQALSTTLLTILITDDGRVYAGSVPLERLQSAAADG